MQSVHDTVSAKIARVVWDVVGENTLSPVKIALFIFIIEVELVCERVAIGLHRARSVDEWEPNAVGHAHGADTSSIVFPSTLLDLALVASTGLSLSCLESGYLIKHNLEATFRHMKFSLIFALFFVPVFLFVCQQLMHPLGIFLLCSDLLLCGFEASLRLWDWFNCVISFSSKFP
jgi:hypothetical protein